MIRRIHPVAGAALFFLLFFPAWLFSQRPDSPGRLRVTSDPPGASITIDNQPMRPPTDSTFAVSPGDHSVAVTSAALLHCGSRKFAVPSGIVTTILCAKDGWSPAAP